MNSKDTANSAGSNIDSPTTIRAGEDLDVDRLANFLAKQLPGNSADLSVEQFPSGFSNLTYLIRFGGQEFVLRRPPFGANIKSAHDMGREYRVLSNLIKVYGKVPKPILYCDDESIIGAPFYLMERVRGIILRKTIPPKMELSPDRLRGLSKSLVDSLVELHQIDYEAAELTELGKPDGYVERQVRGWSKRYVNARTDEIAELQQVMEWLTNSLPNHEISSIIHNDFKYDNVVFEASDLSKVIAVLDWEMATIGDPLMDLGTMLGYWAEKGDSEILIFGPTHLPGSFNRQEIIDYYQEKSGLEIANPIFYFVFGLFKLAVIIQQIYARYKKGHTQDERFAGLIHGVRACAKMAATALDRDRIHDLS